MIKRLRYSILLFLASASIINAQPVNDSKCSPKIIGLLPGAPPCSPQNSGNNYGPFVQLNAQTTTGATNDTLGGVVSRCFPAGVSPNDVWYEFIASESHVQIAIRSGVTNPLTDLYIGLYESLNNDCIGLIPRNCYVSSGLVNDTIDFAALAIGVRYRLQIASTSPSGDGNFSLALRSKNICADCMRTSVLQAYPPPVKAAYPPDTTVGFCYSVVGYNEQYGNRLHGIVPLFGSGWDSPTFNVLSLPASSDGVGQWKWFSNLNINGSNESGFFYDIGGDNDPTNNLGDKTNGQPHVWTFCFSVKTQTKSFCDGGQDDLSIQFINYSDGESGSLVSAQTCSNDENYTLDAHMDCCEKPLFAYSTSASCNTAANGTVTAHGVGSSLGYMYDLYNSNGSLLNSNQGFGNYSYNNLVPGNYYLNVTNNSAGCKTGVSFRVEGPVKYLLSQTVFGCGGNCSNQAKFTLTGGAPPQSITWANGDTGPATSTGLCAGWRKVTIVDNTGNCVINDSIFITSIPAPQTAFQYDKTYYCSSDSLAVLSDFPGTGGGNFSLAFTSGGINFSDVNSFTGEVNISNVSVTGYAVIKYEINQPCVSTFLDTIYYAPSLGPVSLTTYTDRKLCYGDPDPLYYNTSSNKIIWYDGFGNNIGDQFPGAYFDPFLASAPSPGSYFFHVTQVDVNSGVCESNPRQIGINVYDKPVVFAGEDVSACPGFGVQLHASGADNYNWQPGAFLDNATSATPVASVDHTTLFYLKGTDLTGCFSFDSVVVYIDSLSACGLVIYNGFTPNNDGHNDFWFIDGITDDPKNRVAVFNRWGEKIWETVNYDNHDRKWEGQNYKGEILPDGTYYYLINYKSEQLKGWVELTR